MHMCCDVWDKKCQVVNRLKCILTQHPYYKTQIWDLSLDLSVEDNHDLFTDSDWKLPMKKQKQYYALNCKILSACTQV